MKIFKWIKNRLFGEKIYLDYASLTPIDPLVLQEMNKYSVIDYANPSSIYKQGVWAKEILQKSRSKVANLIHARPEEIIFTSGGTESNNLAMIGVVENLYEKGVEYNAMHILVSVIEHSSIRECANHLEGKGVKVEIVPVDKAGIVSVDELKKKIKANTVLVSVMTVNNEIGSIQPIREIAKMIRHVRSSNQSAFNFQEYEYPVFHTDASQAPLYLDLNVEKFGVDLLTLDGSKICGPRGVGIIFIKKDTPISPIIFGGGQEFGFRSGTENIAGIAGFAKALEIADKNREREVERISKLKKLFIQGLQNIDPNIKVNGMTTLVVDQNSNKTGNSIHSPHIINVHIPKIDNEFFLLQLDVRGVACSTKSSCLGDEKESYVLKAIGADSKQSIRFSFGRWTTRLQVERTLKVICTIYKQQR
jgi:cysteine desulfurase